MGPKLKIVCYPLFGLPEIITFNIKVFSLLFPSYFVISIVMEIRSTGTQLLFKFLFSTLKLIRKQVIDKVFLISMDEEKILFPLPTSFSVL